jgi:hypothetical protein
MVFRSYFGTAPAEVFHAKLWAIVVTLEKFFARAINEHAGALHTQYIEATIRRVVKHSGIRGTAEADSEANNAREDRCSTALIYRHICLRSNT